MRALAELLRWLSPIAPQQMPSCQTYGGAAGLFTRFQHERSKPGLQKTCQEATSEPNVHSVHLQLAALMFDPMIWLIAYVFAACMSSALVLFQYVISSCGCWFAAVQVSLYYSLEPLI
ncbi:hypothetical protein ABBQ32_012800 [Trebouxia sp. C0010 RCD-2024]